MGGSFPDWCRAPPEVSKESSKNGEDLVVNEHRRVKLHKFEGSREGRSEGRRVRVIEREQKIFFTSQRHHTFGKPLENFEKPSRRHVATDTIFLQNKDEILTTLANGLEVPAKFEKVVWKLEYKDRYLRIEL
ncbi:hypothetical protein HZH68_013794 [Vespula germanica]|uniref:Uncharacterized protein n=1 Tax=Vespula germanica TaxID=30212 RepID=A0A834JE07_VESGE|nr:hypothetical protein HZH68_013794 [Vespula germanica]